MKFEMSIFNNKIWRIRLIFCSHSQCEIVIQSKTNCNQTKVSYWTKNDFRELKIKNEMLRNNSTKIVLTKTFTIFNVTTFFKFDHVIWFCFAILKNCELIKQTSFFEYEFMFQNMKVRNLNRSIDSWNTFFDLIF